MADRRWCPECESVRWRFEHSDTPHECYDCSVRTIDPPLFVRVKARVGQAIALVVILAILVGPPILAVKAAWGQPLFATREVTITTTQVYGAIPDALPILFVWAFILLIGYGIGTGALPRMR